MGNFERDRTKLETPVSPLPCSPKVYKLKTFRAATLGNPILKFTSFKN